MYAVPGTQPDIGRRLTRAAAEQISRNSWMLLLNGALLVVAGVLIFSIDWTVRELATFIGVLFIVQGVTETLTTGLDARVRRANVITGLLSIAAGIAIIVWPGPGIVAVAIFLGAWLIVSGTINVTGAFAMRRLWSGWWLLLILGLLEIPLGVLALANPGATLAALVTVAGIWAVAIGVMRIVLAFELRYLPRELDEATAAAPESSKPARNHSPAPRQVAAERS
jgi:uncharacterized membrane protein HdeD (DUF308 family)